MIADLLLHLSPTSLHPSASSPEEACILLEHDMRVAPAVLAFLRKFKLRSRVVLADHTERWRVGQAVPPLRSGVSAVSCGAGLSMDGRAGRGRRRRRWAQRPRATGRRSASHGTRGRPGWAIGSSPRSPPPRHPQQRQSSWKQSPKGRRGRRGRGRGMVHDAPHPAGRPRGPGGRGGAGGAAARAQFGLHAWR